MPRKNLNENCDGLCQGQHQEQMEPRFSLKNYLVALRVCSLGFLQNYEPRYGGPYSEAGHQRTMRVLAFILLLAGVEVAAQPAPEPSTSTVILDANGNQAVLGKK
jgi:hypothetical protein